MQKNRSTLRVKPLQRYDRPRYPRHSEPNPLDHPESLPYPFSQRLLNWFVATGLFSAAGMPAAGAQQPGLDSLYNPFELKTSGLPYTPVMFGTGLPDRLDEKDVRTAIEAAFTKEGLTLKRGRLWQSKAGELYLDGFDSVSHLGYVYLDYNKLAEGTRRPVRYENDMLVARYSRLEEDLGQELQNLFESSARKSARKRYDNIRSEIPRDRRDQYDKLIDQIEAGDPKKADTRVVENFFFERRLFTSATLAKPQRELVEALIRETNSRKRKTLMQQLFYCDKEGMLAYYWGKDESLHAFLDRLAALALRAAAMQESSEKDVRSNAIRQALTLVNFTAYDAGWEGLSEKLQLDPKIPEPEFEGRISAMALEFGRLRASMPELEALDKESREGRNFILALSSQSPYTIVRNEGFWPEPMPDSVKHKNVPEREKWYTEQQEKIESQKTEHSLDLLEKEVRRFIRWARAEGRY